MIKDLLKLAKALAISVFRGGGYSEQPVKFGFTITNRESHSARSASEHRVECPRHVTCFLQVEQASEGFFDCHKMLRHSLSMTRAFTMAEILISLTIIGIIAAITLPALQANINEKTWATQRKALYSRMSQAISLLPSLNGYGEYAGSWSADVVSVEKDTAAQAFVTDGLSKVLQLKNICSVTMSATSEAARNELKKCGLPDKIKSMDNMNIEFPTKLSEVNVGFTATLVENSQPRQNPQKNIDTRAAAMETVNGESIAVFYNPSCVYKEVAFATGGRFYPYPYMCANFIYDLNGRKGPNKMGKDVGFMTALYPVDSEVVAPMPNNKFVTGSRDWSGALSKCNQTEKGTRLPNYDEMFSILINKAFIGNNTNSGYAWTSTPDDESRAWGCVWFANFLFKYPKSSYNGRSICIFK